MLTILSSHYFTDHASASAVILGDAN